MLEAVWSIHLYPQDVRVFLQGQEYSRSGLHPRS